MSKKPDIEDALKGMVKEAVIRTDKQPESYLDEAGRGNIEDEEAVADLLSHVPPDEDYYLKLYKKYPVPKEYGNRPVFLLDISQPELISDIESEVLRLAERCGWTDGVYEAKLFKRGTPGLQASRRITIQLPSKATKIDDAIKDRQPSSIDDTFNAMERTAGLVKSLQEISPSQNQSTNTNGTDPKEMLSTITEAYKIGAESAARSTSSPTELAQAIKAMKDLVPQPTPSLSTADLLRAIKEISTPPAPVTQPDPFAMLVKLKELFPEPQKQEDSTGKALEMVTNLLPLIEKLSGGSGETSAATEIIRTLGPQVGKIIGDVTGTINNAISAKGQRPLQPAQQSAKRNEVEATTYSRLTPTPTIAPAAAQEPIAKGEDKVLPVFRAIQEAAEASNTEFYPQLETLLERITTQEQFEQILDGRIAPQQILTEISQWGGAFFTSPTAESYLNSFIQWKKEAKTKEVIALCKKCDAEYVFTDTTEFEQNQDCPDCKEKMELVR